MSIFKDRGSIEIEKPKAEPEPAPQPPPKPAQTPEPEPAKPASGAKITTGQDPDEGTGPWYRRMFAACEVDPGLEGMLKKTVERVISGRARYQAVEEKTGVPWWVLGCLHWKEASCSFAGVLHNGERIIGTGKKTSIVPKGRGPFSSWEEAAIDAITLNGARWAKLRSGSRDIGDILYACERFNGSGYISGAGKAETSPYLWACSNINDDRGKYVSDGKFDPNASTQSTVGVALIIKDLWKRGLVNLTGTAQG